MTLFNGSTPLPATSEPLWFWFAFGAFILGMLALDLGVFHKKSHVVSFREALSWTLVWCLLATLFGLWVWSDRGAQAGKEFFTGYVIELSLSADNVFVFVLIFSFFQVPLAYQHKVLFWGVLSALVLRLVMILLGSALIAKAGWVIYLFGGFLVYTGIKMLFKGDDGQSPDQNPVIKWFTKRVPTTADFRGDKFFIIEGGKRLATPLLVVLLCVEISDVIFAVDSIPAIFGITKDPFIVFTSNVFAIMGLRSLYFVLAGAMHKFYLLQKGLAIILAFVGVKMILAHSGWFKLPTEFALIVVLGILAGSVIGSLIWPKSGVPAENNTPQ